MIILKDEDFQELIKNDHVIVDFYADWCGPCKMFARIFEDTSKNNEGITFIKVNVDEHPDIARTYGVMSIPTIIKFNNAKEITRRIGFINQEELNKIIKGE